MGNRAFKDLIVWQKSMDLVIGVYEATKNFPKDEIYGLTSQMRRSAVSIPSNISEGRLRGTDVEFHRFLRISYGSSGELETQIELSRRLGYISNQRCDIMLSLLDEIMRMLNALFSKPPKDKEATS